ncbi:MAG: Abortive infection protein [Herbinix sp.]|jgi:membrane protease YdiL (CAAX protease family)|nr:Abortive infection protein [Herbinix sp.]
MKTLIESKSNNLSLIKVALLIFIPTTTLTISYYLLGQVFQSIPSLLLFFALATIILFPIELAVVLCSSKKEFGRYSLKSAFVNQGKTSLIKTLLFSTLLFGFAGIVSATIGPFENWVTTPLSNKLIEIIPAYYDWNNMEYLRQYPKNILLLTCIAYALFNIIVGPVIEELFFRGYLTSKISRFGKWAPVIITVLFSLYHFWLPLQNLFRICVFLPAAYIAWRQKNIYISMIFHILCNLFSTISFIIIVFSI